MSLNECFIVLMVSSFSLLKKKTKQDNVSQQAFTNAVTIYKVKLILPLSTIKIRLLNLLEFEIEMTDSISRQKKITHEISKAINWSFECGVL